MVPDRKIPNTTGTVVSAVSKLCFRCFRRFLMYLVGWLKLVFWQALEDKICEGTNLFIQIEKIYWRLKALELQGSFGGNSDYHFEDVIHVQHCWSSPGIFFFKEEIQRHEGFQILRTNHELSLNIKQKSSSGTIDMFFSLTIIISLLGFIGITESHLVDDLWSPERALTASGSLPLSFSGWLQASAARLWVLEGYDGMKIERCRGLVYSINN